MLMLKPLVVEKCNHAKTIMRRGAPIPLIVNHVCTVDRVIADSINLYSAVL